MMDEEEAWWGLSATLGFLQRNEFGHKAGHFKGLYCLGFKQPRHIRSYCLGSISTGA